MRVTRLANQLGDIRAAWPGRNKCVDADERSQRGSPMIAEHADPNTIARPPDESLKDIASVYILSRCLHVIAELGVADALDDRPSSAAELATAVAAEPNALGRVLRLLSAHDIFAVQDGAFTHTEMSRLLRTDHPGSMHAVVQSLGSPLRWATFGALGHSLRTGRPAAEDVHPGGLWGYLAQIPTEAAVFNAAMAGKARSQVAGVLASYDFSRFTTIADIGGGRGHLLRAILAVTPTARGVLFDLPRVVNEARGVPQDRLTLQPGDFFKDALPACDVYLLMEVLHDWADAQAFAILQSVRRAASHRARLLVIERMVPDGPGPDFIKLLDVGMLAMVGGRQRSREEYASLLNRAGFTLKREIDTRADVTILEAIAS